MKNQTTHLGDRVSKVFLGCCGGTIGADANFISLTFPVGEGTKGGVGRSLCIPKDTSWFNLSRSPAYPILKQVMAVKIILMSARDCFGIKTAKFVLGQMLIKLCPFSSSIHDHMMIT